jgi:hypothetical protein
MKSRKSKPHYFSQSTAENVLDLKKLFGPCQDYSDEMLGALCMENQNFHKIWSSLNSYQKARIQEFIGTVAYYSYISGYFDTFKAEKISRSQSEMWN